MWRKPFSKLTGSRDREVCHQPVTFVPCVICADAHAGVINIVEWAMDVVLGSTSAIIVGSKPFARDEEWKREMRLFEDLTDTVCT